MRAQLYDVLNAHATAYPRMLGQDYSCIAYESEFGSRDINEESPFENLVNELNAIKTDALEPMTVEIGGGYSRLNLPPVKQYLSADLIYKMMEMCEGGGDKYGYLRKLSLIQRSSQMGILPEEAFRVCDDEPPLHSQLYTKLYGASYRIIPSDVAPIVPAMCLISEAISKSGGARVGIDGTVASGKTWAAELIKKLFDGCNVSVTEGRGVLMTEKEFDVSLFLYTDKQTRLLRIMERGGEEAASDYTKNGEALDEELLSAESGIAPDLVIKT